MDWIWGIIALCGVLFAIKLIYVINIALVLPATQGALYVSTSAARIDAFLDAVPMRPDQLLVDMGCGDGRVLSRANRRYGIRAVGYELNPMACLRAWMRCLGQSSTTVLMQNFWTADVSSADVIFCYLFPDIMVRMAAKLQSEARPGAVVVSCNFALPGWDARQVLRPAGALHNDPIYIYRMGWHRQKRVEASP